MYKRPADLEDASRGLPDYDTRRYVLLCLACAVLERADPQITLRVLGERLLALAADPALAAAGFQFTLGTVHERRELVAVCRSLLALGVLQRVAGDEEAYVRSHADAAEGADALYDVRRRVLAGMLAAVRGPSTWPADQAPQDLQARLDALVEEHQPDSEEGRRTALRHHLARRLLDDPVVYLNDLDADLRSYFINQRGAMASRLCEATGLVAEQRAEGLALSDESGELTDIAMPAEGTEAHVTLLVAEFLSRLREAALPIGFGDVVAFLADARKAHGSFWRKSANEPGAERELAQLALDRLQKLQLLACEGGQIKPLPALARFALGTAELRQSGPASIAQNATPDSTQNSLFD